MRLAVQVSGIGIYDTDFEKNRARFSPELCFILGLPPGTEMTYTEAGRLFDERDRAAVSASLEAARDSADEGKWSGVHRILRADGTVRWVSIHGRRHYRDTATGRQTVRSIGTVIDITHLKETEAALRQSELRLRLALEAAQMGTFEADTAGSQPSMPRRPVCSACRRKHGLFPPMKCVRAYPSRTCRQAMQSWDVCSSKAKHTSTSFAFTCPMGPSAG